MLRSDIHNNQQTGLNTLEMRFLDINRCEKVEYILLPPPHPAPFSLRHHTRYHCLQSWTAPIVGIQLLQQSFQDKVTGTHKTYKFQPLGQWGLQVFLGL